MNQTQPSGGPTRCDDLRRILVFAGAGFDRVSLGDVTRSAFDSLAATSVSGQEGEDRLIGSEIGDDLLGGGGVDSLLGGNGPDHLVPGPGGGEVMGGKGHDTVSATGDGDWQVNDARLRLVQADDVTTLGSIEVAVVKGGASANVITAGAFTGNLRLDGRAGGDLLQSGTGNDRLVGGDGNDFVQAGSGRRRARGRARRRRAARRIGQRRAPRRRGRRHLPGWTRSRLRRLLLGPSGLRFAEMPADTDDLLPAERKVAEELGHLPLDFRAMAAVSNLFRASAAIRRHMEAKILADDRLSWTSFVAMWVLWVWGEMESRDLAAAVGISRPTSTGIVTTLEGRGFVRRSKTAEDGRLVRVSLTTTGRRKIEKLFPRFNAEEVELTTHLEPEQQEQFAGLLRSMLRRVGDGE